MIEDKNKNSDLTEIDRIFEKFPAPGPSPVLIEDIKRRINLRQKRISVPNLILKTAAVAAVVLLTWFFLLDDVNKPVENVNDNFQNLISQADNNISEFEKEIELLRSELLSVRLNEYDGTNGLLTESVTSLEAELIEIDNSFWKG